MDAYFFAAELALSVELSTAEGDVAGPDNAGGLKITER